MTLEDLKSYLLLKVGTNRDGWFTNEDLGDGCFFDSLGSKVIQKVREESR